MYDAHDPAQLDRLPETWVKYQGHKALGDHLKALRAKYNQLSQAAESAEAAEEPLGLTLPEAGVSLLEIHAVAHTENDALPCLQHGWSDAVKRLDTTAGASS